MTQESCKHCGQVLEEGTPHYAYESFCRHVGQKTLLEWIK